MLNILIYLCLDAVTSDSYLCYHNTDTDVYIGVAFDPERDFVSEQIDEAMDYLKSDCFVPFCDNSMPSVLEDIEQAELVAEVIEGKLCLK